MWWSHVNFILVATCVFSAVENSFQKSSPSSNEYKAAVVEYHPYNTGNDTEVFQRNVENYDKLIAEAARPPNNVDIIVFPECGLATLSRRIYSEVPSPTARVAPCSDRSDKFGNLRGVSCAAEREGVYVVINLYEVQPCSDGGTSDYGEPCPTEIQAFYYNTDVVFDRRGTVIARYRKFNLFGETGIGIPPKADVVTFDTDFGVTFGIFTCFDIMFEKPAVQLVREKKVSDVIFPTAWFSELPFLTAVQAQTAWAHGMDVNFLGSGYNDPALGCGGSGIFSGRRGPLVYVMPSTPSTHLLVATVPKRPREAPQHDNVTATSPGMFMKKDDLTPYETRLLDLSVERNQKMEICQGEFCCYFEVFARKPEGASYTYRAVVFNGVRSFDGVADGGMQVCAVVACTDKNLSSCGTIFPAKEETPIVPIRFRLIRVRGTFKRAGTQLANTLVEGYEPLDPEDYVMLRLPADSEDLVTSEMILVAEETMTSSPLLTFGIYGRDFTRDAKGSGNMAAATSTVGFTTILPLALRSLHTSV